MADSVIYGERYGIFFLLFNQKRNNEPLASKQEFQNEQNLKIKLEIFVSLKV